MTSGDSQEGVGGLPANRGPHSFSRVAAAYLLLLALIVPLGLFLDSSRRNLAEGGDYQTLQVLNEDYHWAFVVRPRRVDRDKANMTSSGKYMYPTLPLVYLPHMLTQLLVSSAGSSQFIHSFSLYVTLLLLSLVFFVGVQRGLSVTVSLLISCVVLFNPFVLHLLVSAPVVPSCALLPLAYLLYLRKQRFACTAVLVLVTFSYRIASAFMLLLFLAEDSERDPGKLRSDRLFLVKLLAVLVVLQVVSQFALVFFDEYMRSMEGPRIEYALSLLFWFMRDSTDDEALFRFAQLGSWFSAGGFVLFARSSPVSIRKLLLPLAVAGYIWLVTGIESQSMVLFSAICGLVIISICRPASDTEGTASCQRRSRVRGVGLAGAALLTSAMVCAFVPIVRDPSVSAVGAIEEPEHRRFTTPLAFFNAAARFPPDDHLAAALETLAETKGGERCLVDPYVVPFVSGTTCREIIPVGKEPQSSRIDKCDYLIVDLHPNAREFHRLMTRDVRVPGQWARNFNSTLDLLEQSSEFGVAAEADDFYIFAREHSGRVEPETVKRARVGEQVTP